MQAADRLDLGGQGVVAEKPALLHERNPELSDVAQRLAAYGIKSDPKRPLAVRRLFPGVYLRHGNLLLATTCHLYRISPGLSSLQMGFSPQPTVRTEDSCPSPCLRCCPVR